MEFKAVDDQLKLIDAASDALAQIKKSKYTSELKSKGVNSIVRWGFRSQEKR